MNAQFTTSLLPLPAALQAPSSPRARHRRPGRFVRTKALARFNQLLRRLQHEPLQREQLVAAWRELRDRSSSERCEAGIEQRLQLAGAVERMIRDATWQAANEAIAPARVVVGYIHGKHELIPQQATRVGRLDDAILLDAAWPKLRGEVDSYLDYCRLRAVEAGLRGCPVGEFTFTREDWQKARRAEEGLLAHVRRVGRTSYLPAATAPMFRVR
ncbi:hypothetical protein [Frateuria soli]|uniref:hypothetical protein n=1 Tax=Frateuria soli TaxID=1542730 RepID=UPI001E5ABC95|nr:hypothetical protein [Frateuria soli]UGB38917.1 hypothetical protein LQ771_03425 [Frateuria soli]